MGAQPNVKIIVATHKKYRMPSDDMYVPVHVGAEGKKDQNGNPLDLGYVKDNTGDNISDLNASFCELTGLYWAWKNLDADYIGLAHYRRHFAETRRNKDPFENILRYKELIPNLEKTKIITPKKRHYYIETLYSHYAHTHYSSHLDIVREIIDEKYPEYADSYEKILNQRSGYMFNMMIMDKVYLDQYCTWLFDILFDLSNKVDGTEYSSFQGRFYGRVSEIIFNVWLDYQITSNQIHRGQIKEIPCMHMEKINWWKKGTAFLKAKFFGVKYEGSF